jgi:hypothetical protein
MCNNKVGLLWDDFAAHSAADVKEFCQSLSFLGVDILPGGLTPVGQPLDKVINKGFKGYFRDLYDQYILSAEVTDKGNPKPPSRQLLSIWVVQAWEMIPAELVRKSWTACGYPSENELTFDDQGQIVVWNDSLVGDMIKKICGQDARDHFEDIENGDEDIFDLIADDDDSEDEEDN